MMGGDQDCSSKGIMGIHVTDEEIYLLIVDPHFIGTVKSREQLHKHSWVKWQKLSDFIDTSNGRKRAGIVDDGAACSLVKRVRCNYHYVLASESSHTDEEGTESVHSIQAKETDYCKDTTDTDTKSENMVEYEIVSSSENAWQLRAISSSSGEDVLVTPRALAISKITDSNIDIWPTGDEDDDETASVNSLSAAHFFQPPD
ncbi:UFM1 specific peptidase 1 [Carabus blaptoides fortunei]